MQRPKSVPVIWMPVAIQDLGQIVGAIAADSSESAASIADPIGRRASSLSNLSERGRVVPELAAHGLLGYRELIVAPWRLFYRIEKARVVVLAVFDDRRNMEDLLLDRLLASPEDETDREAP